MTDPLAGQEILAYQRRLATAIRCSAPIDGAACRLHNVLQKVVLSIGRSPMGSGITTSIRMPNEVRELYETLSRATGRARNDLMVEALRLEGQRRIDELALILEGGEQARTGRTSPLEDAVARFKARGMLPVDFEFGTDVDDEAGA